MSEDDSTTPGSAGRRGNPDRRTPRFSWNMAYEACFFRSLCESMQLGYKENHSFKAGAWERAAVALRDKHAAYPEKSHLINKADNARKKFRLWRGLREDPEFLYNPNTRMVTASEEAWQRHFEKEPLSKALRGRPFDHEEFMEVLFPDVIGSGGAPKRVMKKRKGPDGTPIGVDESDTQGQTVMDLTMDPHLYSQSPAQTQPALQQQLPPTPQMPPSSASQQITHPSSVGIPPRTSVAPSSAALTPPDETPNTANSRKRFAPDSAPGQSERRRGRPSRFATNFYESTPPPSTSLAIAPPATPPQRTQPPPPHSAVNTTAVLENGLLMLAESLRARNPPKWAEQAMEVFFRDFADEDADLQLKIAEKALTDENKAMVFVKSTPELRRHWVGRLREVHLRGLGLGRLGEEAS